MILKLLKELVTLIESRDAVKSLGLCLFCIFRNRVELLGMVCIAIIES